MDNDVASSNLQFSEEEIKVLAEFFSLLIDIEQDLKNKAINDKTDYTSNNQN